MRLNKYYLLYLVLALAILFFLLIGVLGKMKDRYVPRLPSLHMPGNQSLKNDSKTQSPKNVNKPKKLLYEARQGKPNTASRNFYIKFTQAVFSEDPSNKNAQFIIKGISNLPNGTRLKAVLKNMYSVDREIVSIFTEVQGGKFDGVFGPYDRKVLCDIYIAVVFFYPGFQEKMILNQTGNLSFLTQKVEIAVGTPQDREKEVRDEATRIKGIFSDIEKLFDQAKEKYQELKQLPPEKGILSWEKWHDRWNNSFQTLRENYTQNLYKNFCSLFRLTEHNLFTTFNVLEDMVLAYGADLGGEKAPFSRVDELLYMSTFNQNFRVFRFDMLARAGKDPIPFGREVREILMEIDKEFPDHMSSQKIREELPGFLTSSSYSDVLDLRCQFFLRILALKELYLKLIKEAEISKDKDSWYSFSNQYFLEIREAFAETLFAVRHGSLSKLPGAWSVTKELTVELLVQWRERTASLGIFKFSWTDLGWKTPPESSFSETWEQVCKDYGLENIEVELLYYHFLKLEKEFQTLLQKYEEIKQDKEFDEGSLREWVLGWQGGILKLQQLEREIEESFGSERLKTLRFEFNLLVANLTQLQELACEQKDQEFISAKECIMNDILRFRNSIEAKLKK